MFRGLINDAKSAATSVVARYAARASVAVPFIIAVGFAVAAATSWLIEIYGTRTACLIVAASFTVIGFIAALVVGRKEHEEVVAETVADSADTMGVAAEAATQAAVQLPLALLGALFSSPVGPASALKLVRVLSRNLPLVLLLVMIGVLFWPKPDEQPADAVPDDADEAPRAHGPNGADHSVPNGHHREAA